MLCKREAFAVSLRREKKVKILAAKRQHLMNRLKLSSDLSQSAPEIAPKECINALKNLDWILRHSDRAQREPLQVLECLKEIDASLKSGFPADRHRAQAISFMTDQGALFNIA